MFTAYKDASASSGRYFIVDASTVRKHVTLLRCFHHTCCRVLVLLWVNRCRKRQILKKTVQNLNLNQIETDKTGNQVLPRLCGGAAARSAAPCVASCDVSRAARRIPYSGTPCGPDAACDPSGSGRGHISVGLRALVNIIGRWCVKLTVPVRTPRATSPIKLSRDPLYSASTIHRSSVLHWIP